MLTQYRIEDIRNNYAGLLHLALQIIKSENEPDKELLKKLEWIKENTTKRLMTNYFIIVHTIARKMSYSLMTPIEVKVGERKTREFTLGELISEVEEAHIAINDIVKEVAKNYSIDIPYGKTSGGIKIPELPKELQ